MEHRILYINFLLLIWFPPVRTIVLYTLGSNCSLPLGSACPGVPNSECDSQGKCDCRQPDYYLNTDFHACQQRVHYGSSCLSGRGHSECSIGLSCVYIQANLGNYCVCPTGQFCYPAGTGMCRNVATLRANNLHLNGPPLETELRLAWDGPLNVSDPLTYRMVINGTEEITPINATMYTLTNRQPGTPYQIQIYASTFKDFGVTEEKIENNNPLQGMFHTGVHYGSICLSGRAQFECSIGLSCVYIQANLGNYCVCPTGQFCYQPGTGMCRNVTTLRANNLHLNGPPHETELSLVWDGPLNVSDPLTYRMMINGTEEITPINANMYTLTNRQPGTPYQIQIYTSTFKDFGVTEEKIENNNPLQGTLCTAPVIRGSLATNTFPTPSVTLQFSESEDLVSLVEMNGTTVTANSEEPPHDNQVDSTGAIVGGVVGGLCFVVIVAIVIYKKCPQMIKISPFKTEKIHTGNLEETKSPEGILY